MKILKKKFCLIILLFLAAWAALPGVADAAVNFKEALKDGNVGVSYEENLFETYDDSITWTFIDGNLPTGLEHVNGVIYGTPTLAGTFSFTITASVSGGNEVTRGFSITIEHETSALLRITTSTLSNGRKGVYYSQSLTATETTVEWTIVGRLPDGLTLSKNGVISGMPGSTGTFGFTVKALSTTGKGEVTKWFSISIAQAVQITTDSLEDGYLDWYYSERLSAVGAEPIYWAIVRRNEPSGLEVGRNSGTISGWPTRVGRFRFIVRASNAYGSDEKDFEIYIWDSLLMALLGGCNTGAGYAAAAALLIGIRGARGYWKRKNRKKF